MQVPLLVIFLAAGAVTSPPAVSRPLDHHAVSRSSGLDIIPVMIGQSGTQPYIIRVEVARTPLQQQQGLMWRTTLRGNEGMLFQLEKPTIADFWMKNTLISLDLVFIRADHRVSNVAANAVPLLENPLLSSGPVVAVLELKGGRAAQLHIEPGTLIEWQSD